VQSALIAELLECCIQILKNASMEESKTQICAHQSFIKILELMFPDHSPVALAAFSGKQETAILFCDFSALCFQTSLESNQKFLLLKVGEHFGEHRPASSDSIFGFVSKHYFGSESVSFVDPLCALIGSVTGRPL
jgi:hypothetical protein